MKLFDSKYFLTVDELTRLHDHLTPENWKKGSTEDYERQERGCVGHHVNLLFPETHAFLRLGNTLQAAEVLTYPCDMVTAWNDSRSTTLDDIKRGLQKAIEYVKGLSNA
jgi:hypothetical protein